MSLTDCFIELIAYVAYFAALPKKDELAFEQVRGTIGSLMSESAVLREGGNFSQTDYDLARFAVFAWIDETIMKSSWEGKSRWQMELLQNTEYHTTSAGVKFFEHLKNLEPDQNGVREVYYICLSLGFSGRYSSEADSIYLNQIKASNLKFLTGSSKGVASLSKETLFSGSYQASEQDVGPKNIWSQKALRLGLLYGAPVLIFGITAFICRFLLNSEINLVP